MVHGFPFLVKLVHALQYLYNDKSVRQYKVEESGFLSDILVFLFRHILQTLPLTFQPLSFHCNALLLPFTLQLGLSFLHI